jgi:hypothetical protein
VSDRPIAWATLVVAIAAALAYANATLNHFFVFGAMSDSLWFAGLFWHIDLWMTNPQSLDDRSYYATHFSPFLYIPGLLSRLVPTDPITYFAAANGVLHGMASAAFAGTVALAARRAALGATAAVLVCLATGVVLIALPLQFLFLILPHFEIVLPALLIAFLAALADDRDRLAAVLFVALLSVREDAGLHAAMFLLAWAGAQRLDGAQVDRRLLGFAACGVLWSIVAFALGPIIAGAKQDIVRGLYLGDPLFAHMAPERILERVLSFARQRTELWWPLAVIALVAAWWRDARLAAGVAAVIPWIGLNVGFGAHPANSMLAFYYAFPLLVAFAWPSLRLLMAPQAPGALRRLGALQAAVLLAGFAPGLGPDGPEWGSRWPYAAILDLEGLRQRPHYVAFAEAFRRHRATLGDFVATGDVIGLAPDDMPRQRWAEEVDRADTARIASIDTLMIFEWPGGCVPDARLRESLELPSSFEVVGTRVVIFTRRPVAELAAWGGMLVVRPPDVEPCRRPPR